MNVLNGYSKSTLTDNNVLTASGGHKAVGNANGNIPLNNGTLNTNLNADMLDGRHRNNLFTSLQEWVTVDKNTFLIKVEGDKDTYYPVIINSTVSSHLPNIITIFKHLGTPTADYTGNHSSGTTSMLYRYEVKYTGWDGNNGYIKTLIAKYSYTPTVAHTACDTKNNGSLIIWLRGGGTEYTISATYPISKSETIDGVTKTVLKGNIYYEKTELTSDFYVEPKTEIGNAGIYNTITNCFGNALTATKADRATLADRATTIDKITHKTITSNFDTQYRTQTKGDDKEGWYLSVIRNDTSGIITAPQYGTGLAFGKGDTHSYLYTSYSDPLAYIGGGNVDRLNWIKQLVFTDGVGASGNWDITSANSNKLGGLYSYQYFRQLGTNANINSFGDNSNKNGIIYINTTDKESINSPFKYGSILSLNINAASWMLACQSNGKLLFRDRWWSETTEEGQGGWSDWKELAFKSDIPTTSTFDSRYVKKSGDIMSGNLEFPKANFIIQKAHETDSNYVSLVKWYKGNASSSGTYDAQIGWYNIGNSNGTITILPYKTTTSPWGGTVGLYIGKTLFKYNSHNIFHSGSNTISINNTSGNSDTVTLELYRKNVSSWRLQNKLGDLYIQNNYTTTVGDYFDVLTLNYNTGTVTLKGSLKPFDAATGKLTLGTPSARWLDIYATKLLEIYNSTGGVDLGTKIIGKTYSIGFIIGTGNINRGIYDYTNERWILYQDDTNTNFNSHTKFNSGITVTNGITMTSGQTIIKGTAASKPLVVRSIVGYDGSANIAELYLQYGADKAIHLGNTGAYTISKDGGTYSGAAAKLSVNGGSVSKPVYFANGVPTEVTSIDNSLINSTNGTSTLSWGTEVTLATIAGQAIKAKLPSNPNVDTKVTQTPTTINGYRPIVLSNLNNNGETTNSVYTTNLIQVNPSNGVLQITGSGGLVIKGSEKEDGSGYNNPPQIKFLRGSEDDNYTDWAIGGLSDGFQIRYIFSESNGWVNVFKATTTGVAIPKSLTVSGVITSTVADGNAPFKIISKTKVDNLNADMLDGYTSGDFCRLSIYTFSAGSNTNVSYQYKKGLECSIINSTNNSLTLTYNTAPSHVIVEGHGTKIINNKTVTITISSTNSEGYSAGQGKVICFF